MPRSLRAQLSLSILLVLLLAVSLIGLASNRLTSREFEDYIAREEKARSEAIVSDLNAQYVSLTRSFDQSAVHTIGMYALYSGYILKLYDAGGGVVWDAEHHDMSLCQKIMGEIDARMRKAQKSGSFQTSQYTLTQGGETVGTVSIKYYAPFFFSENDHRFLGTMNIAFLVIALLAAAFSVAAGSLLARRIARPVATTADIATQIARGNYDIRIESETKTKELRDLLSAVNHLASNLSEQERLRKRLTSDVAHELRTPLTAVNVYLEAMIEGVWEATPERLKGCHEEIERLVSLVADLEQLVKVEGENLRLSKSRVDFMEIARAVGANLEAEARRKGMSIGISGEECVVEADRNRITQVLANLVSNAIKYTPNGGHIQVEVKDVGQSGTIRVKDDGIGIPKRDIPLIFERFYRTDTSRSRKTGGAGIGLTIAQSIVKAHGGTIAVESRVNEGSCFTVTIPK